MSKALIKEALDLCNDEEEFSGKKSNSKSGVSSLKSKIKKKQSVYLKNGKNKPKTLIEKYRHEMENNNLEANLLYLKKISKPVANFDLIRSAIEKSGPTETKAKAKEDEPSVFTDDDFKNFAKSYFNRTEST